MIFVCIFAPSASSMKNCHFIRSSFIPLDDNFQEDLLGKTFPCDEWPYKMEEAIGDNKKIMNEACDRNDLLPSEAKETIAKVTVLYIRTLSS